MDDASLICLAPFIGLIAMTASGYWAIGCGWLVVPGLMVAGAKAETAVAISLLQLFPAGIATVWHDTPKIGWGSGSYGQMIALPMCLAAALTACFGRKINLYLTAKYGSDKPIEFLLLLVMLYIGFALIWNRNTPIPEHSAPPTFRGALLSGIGGGCIGLISSTLGIGGGILIRPLLTWKLKIAAVMCNRLVRLLLLVSTTLAGLIYLVGDGKINIAILYPALTMTVGGFFGFQIGKRLGRRMRESGLESLVMQSYLVIVCDVVACLIFKLFNFHQTAMWILLAGTAVLVLYFCLIPAYIRYHKKQQANQ